MVDCAQNTNQLLTNLLLVPDHLDIATLTVLNGQTRNTNAANPNTPVTELWVRKKTMQMVEDKSSKQTLIVTTPLWLNSKVIDDSASCALLTNTDGDDLPVTELTGDKCDCDDAPVTELSVLNQIPAVCTAVWGLFQSLVPPTSSTMAANPCTARATHQHLLPYT